MELRMDDTALRSAFLGDFGIVLKEDMMDRVQKARGAVKDVRHHFSRAKYLLVFERSKAVSFYLSLTGVSPNGLRTKTGGLP